MLQQEIKKINQKDQLSLVVTHEDFLDANGNLHELYAVKRHFGIQEEGDPDLFFNVTQETHQEQRDELLPPAIDSELSGEIVVAHQTYSLLCLVWLRLMTTMTQCQRMS